MMDLIERLKKVSKPEKIFFIKRILATNNEVIGVMVPDSRKIAKEYNNLEMQEVYTIFDELFTSNIHEVKSLAIHILQQYRKKFDYETWKFLRSRMKNFVTWDHIDWLATDIFAEMLSKDISLTSEIKQMAESRNFWERRLAIESTIKLIRKNKLELTFLLAEKLVYDENEYVQKGAGWMLREAGKRNRLAVRNFILSHLDMKNIAFSYATEKMKELRVTRKNKKDYEIFEEIPFNFNAKFEAVGCFLDYKNKFVLLHRQDNKSEGNMWGLPSGKINQGELPDDAMRREILEETGLEIEKDKINFLKKIFVKYKDYDFIYYIYYAKLDKMPEIVINNNEHKAYKWVKPETAIKMKLIPGLDFCIKLFYNIKK